MSDHDAPPIYEYNDEVINDEFFLDESNMLHELSMDDEDLLDVNGDSKTKHFLASGCFHGIVQVWDASRNLKNVFEGLGGGIEGLTCLAISSNSTLALTSSEDGSSYIVKIDGGKAYIMTSFSLFVIFLEILFHNSRTSLIGAQFKSNWKPTASLSLILPCGHGGVTCLTWVGSSCVATGCVDGIVRLWDIRLIRQALESVAFTFSLSQSAGLASVR
ncbi:hypothetical protein JHK82_024754 [Glycine max]|nr:hypothetical protein JHK82_024754 [Glycine max]